MLPTGVQTSIVQKPPTTVPPVVPVAHTAPIVHVAHNAPVAPTFRVMPPAAQAEKPEKFNRSNFKRWQQKMMFYLTTINLDRYLKEVASLLTAKSDADCVCCGYLEARRLYLSELCAELLG